MKLKPDVSVSATSTIMIVEDDHAVAAGLSRGLAALGWGVRVARSAAEALSMLCQSPDISVVVTDIRMPNGSGLELAKAVMETRAEDVATEVIIITGHATADDVATALRLRACDFLHKPFRLIQVHGAITRAIARAEARRTAARARHDEELNTSRLSAELASLRARLHQMEVMSSGEECPNEADRAKVEAAVSEALRSPLRTICHGADLVDEDTPEGIRGNRLDLVRGGVERAVTAIELLEEFNRFSRTGLVTAGNVDLAALVTAVSAAVTDSTGVALTPDPVTTVRPLTVVAEHRSLWRAATLCFEAAIEWAPDGHDIRYGLELQIEKQLAQACLTIVVAPGGVSLARPPAPTVHQASHPPDGAVESLRLLLARRYLTSCAGTLTSWQGPNDVGAIRMTLPLAVGG